MSTDRHAWRAIGTLGLSWVVALLVPVLCDWQREFVPFPRLPVVSILHSEVNSPDLVSIVSFLFRASALAIAAAVMAQGALSILALRERVSLRVTATVWLYSVALGLDVLRAHAYDWFVYLLSFAGLVTLQEHTYFGRGTAWELRHVWMSLPFLVLAVAVLLFPRPEKKLDQEVSSSR